MPVLKLSGGPFDGDTMHLRPWQTAIVVPEGPEGPDHVYSVAADGSVQYLGLNGDRVDRIARLLFRMHREQLDSDEDPLPWEMGEAADQASCLSDAARIVAELDRAAEETP